MKYAVLFIVLTFLVFFLWEVFQATLLHPMQYAFVGFALCVFYLLLSRSPSTRASTSPTASPPSVTTLLIAGYARAVLGGCARARRPRRARRPLRLSLSAAASRGLRAAAGSVGLFLVLAWVMFITRRMNWYDLRLGGSN